MSKTDAFSARTSSVSPYIRQKISSLIIWIHSDESRFLGILTVLFIASFLIPILFAYQVAQKQSELVELLALESQGESIPIVLTHQSLSVAATPDLYPEEGKGFQLVGWFKLSRLPVRDQKVTLFSKIDVNSRNRRGYAVALGRRRSAVRPYVYWRDQNGRGKWYEFADVDIPEKSWFLISVTYTDSRYLGVHFAIANEKDTKIYLAGGYDLKSPVIPISSAPLTVGASHGSNFRGQVGPIGVISKKNLSEILKDILKAMVEDRGSFPSYPDKNAVKLWIAADGKDAGKYAHKVLKINLDATERSEKSNQLSRKKEKKSDTASPKGK